MKKNTSHLMGLLNMNGGIERSGQFREPYNFNHLVKKDRREGGDDLLGLGEVLVEKLKRIKMLHGALRHLGFSPFLEKFLRKNSGKVL